MPDTSAAGAPDAASEHDAERSLFGAAKACILACAVEEKLKRSALAARAWRAGVLDHDVGPPPESIPSPGHPERPRLVAPREVPRRRLGTPEGRAALIHALAHIELNAVNLAWDAVYRFRHLPRAYYDDWVRVADEETRHFGLLRKRLRVLGFDYGDFPAHRGLWEMAVKTADDVLVRMALVPRVLEARGLDVTPGMVERLEAAGDYETAGVLEIIHRDEKGHVAVGSHWYRYCCEQRGLDSAATFRDLLNRHMKGRIKGPFAEAARREAGFTAEELTDLRALEAGAE
ncbi:MAG: ferritin-like domain-containing protein [Gammaproteobacteria bacterium]|nr:ferritin-like domain-containing protein [Gammaproteobacteria bacterium]